MVKQLKLRWQNHNEPPVKICDQIEEVLQPLYEIKIETRIQNESRITSLQSLFFAKLYVSIKGEFLHNNFDYLNLKKSLYKYSIQSMGLNVPHWWHMKQPITMPVQ